MISDNFAKNHVIVPVSSLVKLLLVFGDYGGYPKKYYCVLPKRNWTRCFGDRIKLGASQLDGTLVFVKEASVKNEQDADI